MPSCGVRSTDCGRAGKVPGLWCAQGVQTAAPGARSCGSPHGRAADAPGGPARDCTRSQDAHDDPPDGALEKPLDRVQRRFVASRPDELRVSDFTFVATWSGFVYVAFVIDVFARRIVGWRVSRSMHTELVLDALGQALHARQTEHGRTHHSDHGSQYLSIRYTERLAEAGVEASVGSVGDSYDNALAETEIGLFKTEVISWSVAPSGGCGIRHLGTLVLRHVNLLPDGRADRPRATCRVRRSVLSTTTGSSHSGLTQARSPPGIPGRFRHLYLWRYRRHTTGLSLLKSGVDFATISQWLGHSTLNVTMRYARG